MMTRALDEGHRSLLVPETTSVVFDENNGKLVLISGELRIQESLKDPMYDISIKAVKLKKRVQMYQVRYLYLRLVQCIHLSQKNNCVYIPSIFSVVV